MAKTFKQLQDEVLMVLHGFGLTQPRATFLDQPVGATDLTFLVREAADLDMGMAEIGGEMVFIESVDRSSNTVTIAPDGRGYYGTTAAAHANDARLTFAPTWPRHQVKETINNTIVNLYPDLFGVGQAQFTYTPAVTTYSLPAEAERVLMVTADTNGPSKQQQVLHRYSADLVAPLDEFATTNSITLEEAVSPGRTVTVTYVKQPTVLSADADLLTASGLRESASRAVVYGAIAELVTFMDVSRLPVDTSMADEIDESNQMGLASRLGNQYQLRYQMEVEKERQRLRASTPIPVTVRKR